MGANVCLFCLPQGAYSITLCIMYLCYVQGLVEWFIHNTPSFNLINDNEHIINTSWSLHLKWATVLSWKEGQSPFSKARKHSRLHEPIHVCNWQRPSWENATLLLQGAIERGPKRKFLLSWHDPAARDKLSLHQRKVMASRLETSKLAWRHGAQSWLCIT